MYAEKVLIGEVKGRFAKLCNYKGYRGVVRTLDIVIAAVLGPLAFGQGEDTQDFSLLKPKQRNPQAVRIQSSGKCPAKNGSPTCNNVSAQVADAAIHFTNGERLTRSHADW